MHTKHQPHGIPWVMFSISGLVVLGLAALVAPELVVIALIALIISAVSKIYLWAKEDSRCRGSTSQAESEGPTLLQDVSRLGSEESMAAATIVYIAVGVLAFLGAIVFAAPQVLWLIPIVGIWFGLGWLLDRN